MGGIHSVLMGSPSNTSLQKIVLAFRSVLAISIYEKLLGCEYLFW